MARLLKNSYGKSLVRLTKVTRTADRHILKEISVTSTLEGAFEKSYLTGDNSQIVATDTQKNTVYALAKKHPLDNIESFAQFMGEHFVKNNTHIDAATIAIEEHTWHRINNSPIAFDGSSTELRTTRVRTTRGGSDIIAGIDGLLVLKTTDSEFAGFLRDEFTTLPDTHDRIFSTIVHADWHYTKPPADFTAAHTKARDIILRVFAKNVSLAVQQTIFQMGEEILKAIPEVDRVDIIMPNKHRIPMNMKPFGMEFENDIFITTDEPHGLISGTVVR